MFTPEVFWLLCPCSGDRFAESVGDTDTVTCPSIPRFEKWSKTLGATAVND